MDRSWLVPPAMPAVSVGVQNARRYKSPNAPGNDDRSSRPDALREVGWLVNEALQALKRQNSNFLRSRLRLEHHFFFRERIDAFTSRSRRLLHDLHLQQAGHGEQAGAAQTLSDDALQGVEHSSDLLARQLSV